MGPLPGKPFGPDRQFRSIVAYDSMPVITGVSPNAGNAQGGTAVTITGSNFIVGGGGNDVLVFFDGIAATSVVVPDRQTITCVAPAHPLTTGPIDVVVWVGSRYATAPGAFIYYVGSITALTPIHGPLAGGTQVLIEGYNFVAGSTVTFGGAAATGVNIIDSSHIKATTPAHATGNVDVVVTEPGLATATKRGGFQYTLLNRGEDIRRQPGISIKDVLNNTPNSATFVIDGSAPMPTVGEKMEVRDSFDNGRLLFAGTVQSID
ncbi:MAG: IPT/TIG domain-containing protein, partial [Gemmatimonadota bacterium]|nr:IPT/TIG domain-containing protein [Gemmatimonadota bacterium]